MTLSPADSMPKPLCLSTAATLAAISALPACAMCSVMRTTTKLPSSQARAIIGSSMLTAMVSRYRRIGLALNERVAAMSGPGPWMRIEVEGRVSPGVGDLGADIWPIIARFEAVNGDDPASAEWRSLRYGRRMSLSAL